MNDDDSRIGRLGYEFLKTPYGEYLLTKLAALYNGLHHDAETAATGEEKMFKVERAAGLRIAIDLLDSNAKLYEMEVALKKQQK